MNLEQLYLWAYDLEDPFTPNTKHLSCDFLVSEIADDLSRKVYDEEHHMAKDCLDNLYIKLLELNVSLEDFLDLIYLSQKAEADKYLFTMYGLSSWIFDKIATVYEANPQFLKKLGITKMPLGLDSQEVSNSTDFFTLLNINSLKKQIDLSKLTNIQKAELNIFFNQIKRKAQFEFDTFDVDLACTYQSKEGLKIDYEKLLKSCKIPNFEMIVEDNIGLINSEKKMLEEEEQKVNTVAVVEQKVINESVNKTSQVTFENIDKIAGFIVGQRGAVKRVCDRLMASVIGLKDPNKPLASLMLDGPTGIGKTEMAKAIAKACFGGRIHVEDMSEYKHESDLSRLTGASAGFVGYGDTPALVNFLTQNDSGVILFDEIDKCNPRCLDILMRMIDEGEFQTAKGQMLSTKNMVIVCTTNMSEYVSHKEVGFNIEKPKDGKHSLELASTGSIRKEILGRFDEVIKFEKLSKEECSEIALRYLISHASKFNAHHKPERVRLIPTPQFVNDVIEESNYKVFGGRNVCSVARKFFDNTVVNYYKKHSAVKDKVLVVLGKDNIKEYTNKQFLELRTKTSDIEQKSIN